MGLPVQESTVAFLSVFRASGGFFVQGRRMIFCGAWAWSFGFGICFNIKPKKSKPSICLGFGASGFEDVAADNGVQRYDASCEYSC